MFIASLFSIDGFSQEDQDQEQILNIMSCSQRGRLDEQRCTLSPAKTGQIKKTAPLDDLSQTVDRKQGQRFEEMRLTLPGLNNQVLDFRLLRMQCMY